jgi:hypothetical protein
MDIWSPELNYTKFRVSLNNKFALILHFGKTHFLNISDQPLRLSCFGKEGHSTKPIWSKPLLEMRCALQVGPGGLNRNESK